LDHKQIETYFDGQLTTISKNAISLTTKFFGGVFSVLTIFIISFYWLMYHDAFKKFIAKLFAPNIRGNVLKTLDTVNEKLGAWLRGQIFLCFFIGLMSWIALTLIGVPYALPLALVAGILEAVPTLGPILSAIPAAIVALTVSPALALMVVFAYIVIQALENNILVPNVMQKAVGLNPVVVILSITIGANLMGIAGALLAIPFVSLIVVILQTFEEDE
jgi:predicted PurR-regulated permease PerM